MASRGHSLSNRVEDVPLPNCRPTMEAANSVASTVGVPVLDVRLVHRRAAHLVLVSSWRYDLSALPPAHSSICGMTVEQERHIDALVAIGDMSPTTTTSMFVPLRQQRRTPPWTRCSSTRAQLAQPRLETEACDRN